MVPVARCFAHILALTDRLDFARAVYQHAAEREAKGFSCWDHFVAMLFCQMGSAHSLRETCGGLATALGKLESISKLKTDIPIDATRIRSTVSTAIFPRNLLFDYGSHASREAVSSQIADCEIGP